MQGGDQRRQADNGKERDLETEKDVDLDMYEYKWGVLKTVRVGYYETVQERFRDRETYRD